MTEYINIDTSFTPGAEALTEENRLHSEDDLKDMISNAKKAQFDWKHRPIKQRVKKIKLIVDYLVENLNELSEVIAKGNGKQRFDALVTEIMPSIMATRYYTKNAVQFLKERKVGSSSLALFNKWSTLRYEPLGVIGVISPWNYPFAIAYSEIIMGLLAGNAVILKTATETLMVGKALKKAIHAAGLPEGVFQFINLPGRIAGEAFLENKIDKLFFTGSVPVGKLLMKKAADNLTPVSLELGGNDAMLVCEDADLERATSGAVCAGLQNTEQPCSGVERVYVHENVYDRFLELLKEKVTKMQIGSSDDNQLNTGIMTSRKQTELIHAHIDDAIAKGAKVFVTAPAFKNTPSHLCVPTVLTEVNHQMDVMKEGSFGPVLAVKKVTSIEEAIELANDSNLGLTGSIWSKNKKEAKRIASRIEAGSITINDHLMSHGLAETSWGAFNESGIGRTHGKMGLMEMVEPQFIVHDPFSGTKKAPWWHPYSQDLYDGMTGIVSLFYSQKLKLKLSGLGKAIKILPRFFSSKWK